MNLADRAAQYKAEYILQHGSPPPGPFIVMREEWEHFVRTMIPAHCEPEVVKMAKEHPEGLSLQGMSIYIT